MGRLRDTLHRNNYPKSITSVPRNLDHKTEDKTQKLTTVCLPYVKGLAEKIQKICRPDNIRTTLRSVSTLCKLLLRVKPSTECNMAKNCAYSIPCSCGMQVYKYETCRPLKVRLQEHQKEMVRGKIEKSGIADHI